MCVSDREKKSAYEYKADRWAPIWCVRDGSQSCAILALNKQGVLSKSNLMSEQTKQKPSQ